MRRTFILHAHGAKLPSDLLGLTCVRYDPALSPSELKSINQKIRTAIESEGRVARIEGSWWQFSLTERTANEPSALSLLKISRDRNGALEVTGRSWREDGSLSARYWSEAAKEKEGSSGIFYYWKGERPLDPNAPQLDGTGEIKLESADRASGYFTTRADCRSECEGADSRCLLARRSGRHQDSGRSRRSKTCGAHDAAAGTMEVRQELLIDGYCSAACAFEELLGRITSQARPMNTSRRSTR